MSKVVSENLSYLDLKNKSESYYLYPNPDLESSDKQFSLLFVSYTCSDASLEELSSSIPRVKELFDAKFESGLQLTGGGGLFSGLSSLMGRFKKKKIVVEPHTKSIRYQGLGMEEAAESMTINRLSTEALNFKKFQDEYTEIFGPKKAKDFQGRFVETKKITSKKAAKKFYGYDGTDRFFYSTKQGRIAPPNADNLLNQKKPITIMVHGTGCTAGCLKTGKWANPDGDVANNLRQHYGGDVISFQWDGTISNTSRSNAAKLLAEQMMDLRQKGFEINLVGHSHGGNVILEALNRAKTMSEAKKIKFETGGELVTLARPVRSDYVLSDTSMVSYFTVASGKGDTVQNLGGLTYRGKGGGRKDTLSDLYVDVDVAGKGAAFGSEPL